MKHPAFFFAACALGVSVAGCSSDASTPSAEGDTPATPPEDVLGRKGAELKLTAIYTPAEKNVWSATAVGFNPERPGELWALLRQFPTGLPCTKNDPRGCNALEGRAVIIQKAGSSKPSAEAKDDPNAWHFMRRPTSLSFGADDTFGSCGEARTDNFEDETVDYAGPVLWSSDPKIFAIQPPGMNGSHIDMLHNTPFCMGIAHEPTESGNVYWTFNGKIGSIDRYDFKKPHQPGGEDHSDGEMLRYAQGEVLRSEEIPSHMVYDADEDQLYIADTGHSRVARLDAKSGTLGRDIPSNDPIPLCARMDGAQLDDFVASGDLDAPSGIALYRGTVFVTDNSTSEIRAYDRDGKELRVVDSGLPPGSLAGITVSDDGVVYLADLATGRVLRLDVP